jgi:hypothetical protein
MAASTALVPVHPTSLVPSGAFENWVVFERVPVVLDASTLIGDCLRFVKHGREPLLLVCARQPSIVNLYATRSVRMEVEEHLAEAARENRLPPQQVERFWCDGLRPYVSFVDLEALPPRDTRVATLALVDADDHPTGSLAELLGPCLVFSSDPHLLDSGIARKDWADLLVGARDVSTYQAGTSVTVIGTLLVGSLGAGLGQAALNAGRRWPLPAMLVGLVGGYFLYVYWRSERGVGHRREVRSFAADAGRDISVFLTRAFDASELLERAAFVVEGDPTPLSGVARVVAAAPRPLRPGDIAPRVGYSTQRVTSVLREPIFQRTSEGYYLLGIRG